MGGPFFIGKCVSHHNKKTAMVGKYCCSCFFLQKGSPPLLIISPFAEVPHWIRSTKYGRRHLIRRTTRFMAHDENDEVEPGDMVEIRQSRKYSKRKATIVTRIVQRDPGNGNYIFCPFPSLSR